MPWGYTGPLAVGKFWVWPAIRAARRNAEQHGASSFENHSVATTAHTNCTVLHERLTVPRVMYCMAMRYVRDKYVVRMDMELHPGLAPIGTGRGASSFVVRP